jgi:hypothetical protein
MRPGPAEAPVPLLCARPARCSALHLGSALGAIRSHAVAHCTRSFAFGRRGQGAYGGAGVGQKEKVRCPRPPSRYVELRIALSIPPPY